jgi:hypothetical protein
MHWRDEPVVSMGVSERPFYVARGDEQIPGILWGPEDAAGGLSLVLIGHGGKSEKRNAATLAMARRLAPWSLGTLLPLGAASAWGVAAFLPLTQPPVVVATLDGGATWSQELTLESAFATKLVATSDRIWIYGSTSPLYLPDGPYHPPRRTVIYRRDVAPAAATTPSPSASGDARIGELPSTDARPADSGARPTALLLIAASIVASGVLATILAARVLRP